MMTQAQALILSFNAIRAGDGHLVGGKGANLGEMTHAGFPIPPGFCVTTIAFQQFMDGCPTATELYTLLDTVMPDDVETARQVGRQVRETLLDAPVPNEVARLIRQQWQQGGAAHAVAVRSSATAEDLPDASFAGQQDTYLNIRDEEALLDATRRCWVSLFTDRAILYRCKNHFPHRDVKLAVVVQQMVMAEVSGILFTADPVTGHRHTVAIDASFGLGEALVSGLVSPDSYRVDKRDRTIIERRIADKVVAIFPKEGGGTRQETLPDAQRAQTVLTDAQILELADLGTHVEAYYGAPQDIEWAMAAGQTYLVQSRPITSLYPIDGLQSPDGSLRIYFSAGHQQMMTNAMSPLGMACMQSFVPIGYDHARLTNTVVLQDGGHLYGDLTVPLRHPILRRIILRGVAQFNDLAPEALQLAMRRPEFQRPNTLWPSLSGLRWIARFVLQVQSALWRRDLTGYVEHVNDLIAQELQAAQRKLDETPVGETQVQAIADVLQAMFVPVFTWVPVFAGGKIAHVLLGRLARGWAAAEDLDAYLLGLPGNVITEMNLALGDLADRARRSPALCALFGRLGDDRAAWLAEAAQIEDSAPFFQAWDAFLACYGARGSAEIDIYTPRWYEEPLPLLKVIASYLHKAPGSHRVQEQAVITAREAAVARLIAQANHGLLGPLRARLTRRLIHVAQTGDVLREHHKFFAIQKLRIVKEKLKAMAVDLTQAQKLTQPDDIWYLLLAELRALYRGDALNVADLVATRRTDLRRFEKMAPPMVITSDGESPVVRYHVADAPPGALVGNAVSAGVVEGIAHVIHDPQAETLAAGEILVAAFTDPGWTPLFINAGGLIMEVGGNLTHGAVVAREYGIPAIVNVRDATQRLHTGQHVRVDGNRGIVELL